MVKNGAEIIFVITNDSFVGKAMPHQHFQHAKLRAIELGVPVVQSANNGISGIILPSGEVLIKSIIDERNLETGAPPIKRVPIWDSLGRDFSTWKGTIDEKS